MQTEPEQWAVELRDTLKRLAEANQDYLMDVAIQRALEERERKLREALEQIANVARSPVTMQQIARQALKETPDAQ